MHFCIWSFGLGFHQKMEHFQYFFHPWSLTNKLCCSLLLSCTGFLVSFLAAPLCARRLIVTPSLSSSALLPCFPLQSQCPGGFMFVFFTFRIQAFPFVIADHLQQSPCMVQFAFYLQPTLKITPLFHEWLVHGSKYHPLFFFLILCCVFFFFFPVPQYL